jgi:HEPN domain-containing protein
MPSELTDEELAIRLVGVDADLDRLGFPIRHRPLQAFKIVYHTIADDAARTRLFEPISRWYLDKYGDRVRWDGVIARIPVLLRGNLYLVRVPFTTVDTAVRLTDRIEDLPDDIVATFTPDEFDELGTQIAGATCCVQKLYNLNVDHSFLDDEQSGLVWRALLDLENAANTLKVVGDTQTAVFQGHAAAEKFLKVAVKRCAKGTNTRKFGHKLSEVFQELVAATDRYTGLASSVDALQALVPSMEIRYGVVPRGISDAILAFNAALNVCGMLAQVWLFDFQRGSEKCTFLPGRYYIDGNGSTFFCQQVLQNVIGQKPSAVLTRAWMSPSKEEALMFNLSISLDLSVLYLELTEPGKIEAARALFQACAQSDKRVNPENLKVQISDGPAGSFVTARIRMIGKAAERRIRFLGVRPAKPALVPLLSSTPFQREELEGGSFA